eukprot:14797330-Alexandrium_andersonii.AAC.1
MKDTGQVASDSQPHGPASASLSLTQARLGCFGHSAFVVAGARVLVPSRGPTATIVWALA